MKGFVLFILAVILLLSIIANIYLFYGSQNQQVISAGSGKSSKQYALLAEKGQDDRINNFLPLRQQLHSMTNSYEAKIAIYFQYLPTMTSIGIHEDAEFTAASLMKVPMVMAYFRKKERLGITEDPTVTIKPKNLNTTFGELYKKGAGASVNLSDAVKLTLQKSDNTASFVVADQFTKEDFAYVYQGLDIDPKVTNNSLVMSAEQFAAVLKALYFSSILTQKHSSYILDLMTDTDFSSMLPSGIPDNIPVAHKIGIMENQLYSDCGIVYVPNRPYVLCVVSYSDKATAEKRIGEISKTVYEYVSSYKVN